jgi:hypothetical protein
MMERRAPEPEEVAGAAGAVEEREPAVGAVEEREPAVGAVEEREPAVRRGPRDPSPPRPPTDREITYVSRFLTVQFDTGLKPNQLHLLRGLGSMQ